MKNAIRSEVRKILSTRSVWVLLLLGLVVEVASSFVGLAASKPIDFPARLDQISFLHFGTTNVCLLFVILGIRAVGDEFAYDTITPSLQMDPNRARLLGAEAVTYAGAAALYAVVALGILVPAAAVIVHARHLDVATSAGPVMRAAAGSLAAVVLWTVIGVSLGAIVRHRVPVLVGTLVWLAILETGLQGPLKSAAKFLPGQLTSALTQAGGSDPKLVGPLVAAALLAALGAALLSAGAASLRRDITR
jgi:ABC-2 type transport system permease protein